MLMNMDVGSLLREGLGLSKENDMRPLKGL